jgi:2-methylisocitrate lyase-like PEP mutase family enzyme
MSNEVSITEQFRRLHHGDSPLVLPNPWDLGSARILAALGFKALATTSSGFAQSLGRADGDVSRSEALQHGLQMVNATELPVSADLENGFGHSPEEVAETVSSAVETGLAGCSIEDFSAQLDHPIYEARHAIERVEAAVAAAHALDTSFVVTARAENYLHGVRDLPDTIARLQGFESVGADVLYAPGLATHADVATVLNQVSLPLNVLAWGDFTVSSLGELGVSRISLGGRFARATFGALIQAATQVLEEGTFDFPVDTRPLGDLNNLFNHFQHPVDTEEHED